MRSVQALVLSDDFDAPVFTFGIAPIVLKSYLELH
jgi:hypothetical protein